MTAQMGRVCVEYIAWTVTPTELKLAKKLYSTRKTIQHAAGNRHTLLNTSSPHQYSLFMVIFCTRGIKWSNTSTAPAGKYGKIIKRKL